MINEYITPCELRKIMKTFIAAKIELGFYISLTQNYLNIDQFKNMNPNNVKTFIFKDCYYKPILDLIKAYDRLYKHNRFII